MSQGAWIKLTVGWDEDEQIALLPDGAQLAYIKLLTRAKRQRPQGSFGSMAHLKALMPKNLHRHLSTLEKVGLIFLQDERVYLRNFSKYQVDPTVTERSARWRNAKSNGYATVAQRSDKDKEREIEKDNDTYTKPLSVGAILRGGGR